MNGNLNLVDRLLARGRSLQELGRLDEAADVLNRLTGLEGLSGEVVEQTHVRLAELRLQQQQYRLARRHLAAALLHQPNHPRYHYLMASAVNLDDEADPRRALRHYRKSLRLDPNQPRCRAELGLLSVQLGQTDSGLRDLRRAADMAPDDVDVLEMLLEGLCWCERIEEARRVLQAARFRLPRNGRVQELWSEFEYEQLRRSQAVRQPRRLPPRDEGPVLLPFVRPSGVPSGTAPAAGIVRRDPPSAPSGPHAPPSGRRVSRRRAHEN
jgi:Tfp pilus assembly protein PilF